jgi:pimeloyl-ACP methyl ester carboxylesterase
VLFILGGASTLDAQPVNRNPATSLQERYVNVAGKKFWMRTAGVGSPVVVLDYGLGGRIEDWDAVFPAISRFTRVVAYDRAGYRRSDIGIEPRSQTQIATELHDLLRAAGIPGPYVLAGHSFGAANIRAFAYLFRDEVAGLVFIDPFNEAIFLAQTPTELRAAMDQQEAALKGAPPGVGAEWKYFKTQPDFAELRTFGKPPDVPMMLLVAGRGRPPNWVKAVLDEYGEWVAGASEAGLVVTPESRHYIERDEPDLVISAIRRVVFPNVQNALEKVVRERGVDAAILRYRQMRQRYPADYFFERTLNALGYQQLNSKHVPEAIKLFKLNVEMYPKAFNTYDSLGEAYMVQGDRAAAIKNYRISLALNPKNTGAADAIKKLQGGVEK